MIRNFTIRNRDSRRLFFLNFLLWVKELVNSDCRFGFLVKNCIYSHLETSRIPKFGPKIRIFNFFIFFKFCFLFFLVSLRYLEVLLGLKSSGRLVGSISTMSRPDPTAWDRVMKKKRTKLTSTKLTSTCT